MVPSVLRLAGLLVAATLASPPSLSINVTPTVLFAGTYLRLTCSVQRAAGNRWLEMGIADYSSSSEQLDGDQARITWRREYPHVPCDVDTAFCTVVRNDGHRQTVRAPFQVACSAERRVQY